MSSRKTERIAALEELKAQALEMASKMPPRIAEKLRQNAKLIPSKFDFDSEHEWKYKLDPNDIMPDSHASSLINKMRELRGEIYNLEFVEQQGTGPHNTMPVGDDDEIEY